MVNFQHSAKGKNMTSFLETLAYEYVPRILKHKFVSLANFHFPGLCGHCEKQEHALGHELLPHIPRYIRPFYHHTR